jgi:hypothetical protein
MIPAYYVPNSDMEEHEKALKMILDKKINGLWLTRYH